MKILEKFRVFLFDLDGVLWRGKEVIPGAREVVNGLREQGKMVRFLTNNPRRSREEVWKRLRSFSIAAEPKEIMTASWATASYLRERGIQKSYVLGNASLKEEIRKMGIAVDEDISQAVVVGYDEGISFGEITRAIRLVERGAELVATNPDAVFVLPEGKVPATGSVVQVIERITGRKATVIGKPSPYIFELLLRELGGIERGEMVLVGDSLETDILGAHGVGIGGILYTGGDIVLPPPTDARYPDVVIPYLERLLGKELPPPRKRAVGAVIQDKKGRVLLIRRRDNRLWCLPTGKVEEGEDEQEAVVREMAEELGIQINLWRLRAVYMEDPALRFTAQGGNSFHFVVFLFQGFFPGGTVEPCGEEVEDWGFFPEENFPTPFFSLHRKWIQEIGVKNE